MLKLVQLNIFCFFIILNQLNGQSIQELQKMKAEYEKMKKEQSNILLPGDNQNQLELTSPSLGAPNRAIIGLYENQDFLNDSLDQSLKHFGYNFFIKRDSVAFWENLPTPKNYLLGPGDELILSLWGETQLRQTYIIDRQGNIYDEKVGLLSMIGKTIEEGEKFIKLKFGKFYSTLQGQNPTTYIDLSLGKLRSINVNFVGEVSFPGVYPVHPFSTLITGLIQAGGIDTTGSLRKIIIRRDQGKKKINFDLYEYILKGNVNIDFQLRDQDIVLVPPRLSTIKIDSAVNRPGIYEFIEGETIKEMIDYAGGLRPEASSSIGLERITPINKRKKFQSLYENYYINYNSNIVAQNGDYVTARYINISPSKVEVIGMQDKAYSFNFFEGMTLYNLFDISGLLEEKNNLLKSIYFDNAEIARRDASARYEKINLISLYKFIDNPQEAKNYKLQNLDRLIIHINTNYIQKDPIEISGEIKVPGIYTLSKDEESLLSLLERAGGLSDKALPDGISIYRLKKYYNQLNIEEEFSNSYYNFEENTNTENKIFEGDDNRTRVAWKNNKIILMPGDSVVVKEKTNTINILGEVYNPGLLEFEKNKSLRYYINSAGGITDRGSYDKIIVIYANGVVSPKRWYNSPSIRDGSTIIINRKEEREPFNLTQFATNWSSILSSLITAVILSQQIGSN